MFSFTNFPRGRDFLSSPPLIAVLAAAAIFFTFSAVRIVMRERAIASERGKLEEKIIKLQAEKESLEKTVPALESKEAVERMAKEKLNLKNSGEEVVVIAPDGSAASAIDDGGDFLARFIPDWILQFFYFIRH